MILTQGPTVLPDPRWLDYGALGLLALVLIGIFLALRSYLTNVSQRLDKASLFTESLATQALATMAQYAVAQAEATAAMREVKNSLNNARQVSSKEHDELRDDHRQIMGGLRGGLGRGPGD